MTVNNRTVSPRSLAIIIIVAAALVLRIVNLDADPSALISRDFITDEGWWAHNARNCFFYGQWRVDDYNLGLYSASLYNLLVYLIFKIFGVSFISLRALSAVSGWMTVILVFDLVRREMSARAALYAGALIGFSDVHILYSRTGFTESLLVFFLTLMLWLWSLRRAHSIFALLAGVSLSLMVVAKITAIYLAPGLVLAVGAAAMKRSVTRRHALLFLSGAGVAAAAYAIFFIAPNFSDWLRFNLSNGAGSEWSMNPASLIDSIPRLIGAPFYVEAPIVTALTLLSLGMLVVEVSRNGLVKTIAAHSELEITSVALLIGYFLFLSLAQYQPERRFVPMLLFMVVISSGMVERGSESFKELARPGYQMGVLGWFTILFVLPVIGVVELRWRSLGPPHSALVWVTKLTITFSLIAIAMAMSRGLWPYRFRRGLLVGSTLIFVLLFSGLSLAQVIKALLLWGFDGAGKALAAGLVLVLATLVLSFRRQLQHHAAPVLIGAILLIEGLQISTWLFQPTYTLKDANTVLAATLTPDDTIVTYYETVLPSSAAKVICRSVRRGFNVDAFEKYQPNYTLILRRDNFRDYTLEGMPIEEWPPPANLTGGKVASFSLCPTRLGGARFIAELYSLSPRLEPRMASAPTNRQ